MTESQSQPGPEQLMLPEARLLSHGRSIDPKRLQTSAKQLTARSVWQPDLTPEADLPMESRRDEIIAALQAHAVLIVAGETGSGKTTQLPRYALAAGFGRRGLIGHTQPRRIAARSVAERIASLCGTSLGEGVGYAVRFDDKTGPNSLVRVMTDGVLLAELAKDPLLLRYEVIIIDEAHERSLNIDFLLGILKSLLPKRPDLKVIITSATIDHQRFSAHFDDAPIIEVSGRGFPVEVRYDDEPTSDDSMALAKSVARGVQSIANLQLPKAAEDILVFLPGEREIRDAERVLAKQHPAFDIVPLFGRLSDQQQGVVFRPTKQRRIVLATNVAETSLTVPRIGAVIDSGLARISRYSSRSRVQRLQLEPVSQASANQRAGRCGRIGPGVCLRLYDEADFEARPAYTDPEIRRTNLASVVLQMATLRLGEVEQFPFLDAPDAGQVDDARRLLFELQALDERGRVTRRGRDIARLPLDPRLARMLLGVGETVSAAWLVILVAGLAVQDPRQRPLEHARAADAAHAKFTDAQSDFLSYVLLWQWLAKQQQTMRRSAFDRQCEGQFLSPRRIREWREVATQIARQLGVNLRMSGVESVPDDSAREWLHQRVLSGLLSHVGAYRDEGEYAGAYSKHFVLHPSSTLADKKSRWVMALEIVQTRKRYARINATIDVGWLARLASHLLQYDYDPPYWNARRGRVEAKRTSLLFGLVVRANERVSYAEIDAVAARDVFLRDALAGDRLRLSAPFVAHNKTVREEVALLAGKLRRPVEVRQSALADWFGERLPETVIDTKRLKRWLSKDSNARNAMLQLSVSDLISEADAGATSDLPTTYQVGGNRLKIRYAFAPQDARDGASLQVPQALLRSLRHAQVDASVPAYLQQRVQARLRRLPKAVRKQFQPLAQTAERLSARLIAEQERGPLDERLARLVKREFNIDAPLTEWAALIEPEHLKPRIVVLDSDGKVVSADRDLAVLQQTLNEAPSTAAPASDGQSYPTGREWIFGKLPTIVEQQVEGVALQQFVALQRTGNAVTVSEFLDQTAAHRSHARGLLQLLSFRFAQQMKALRKSLLAEREIALLWTAYDDKAGQVLVDDYAHATLQAAFDVDSWAVRDREAFQRLVDAGAARLMPCGYEIRQALLAALQAAASVRQALESAPPHMVEAHDDVVAQVAALVYPGFLSATPFDRLSDLPRFLQAASLRLERFASNPARDHSNMAIVRSLESRVAGLRDVSVGPAQSAALSEFRWRIEELRVSLFAQSLGTREKVSAKRLEKQWDSIIKMRG
ncbi:MAG: ATP-dependent RNA helicase HrpA [Pseudomonadota bacterium]